MTSEVPRTMARCREPSTGSLGSRSAFSGDDIDTEQHNGEHVVEVGASVAPDDRGGGGGGGRFGIYQGNWGGNRRKVELPERTN